MATTSSSFFIPGKLYEFDPDKSDDSWHSLACRDAEDVFRQYHSLTVFLVLEAEQLIPNRNSHEVRALMPDGVVVTFSVTNPERAISPCHSSSK